MGQIVAVCISEKKGVPKEEKGCGYLQASFGLKDDAHGGDWHRQVSLLAQESIDKMKEKGLTLSPGAFAENLITKGLDLVSLPIGTQLLVGDTALLEVTQIGKECHTRCAIYEMTGDCIMPREGIFARVLCSGPVSAGDVIGIKNVPINRRDSW